MKKNNRLRFAPIIRVSTEGQEKKGESLRIQKDIIVQSVKSLDGIILEHCWKYSGQEHATPEQERKMFDLLLADSDKDLFDAVMVMDSSRWSRDNRKSKEGIQILKKNGIRFFVGMMEYDLFNPDHTYMLGMSVESSEHQANQMSLKSVLARIEKAKQGFPMSTLPTGRTFDRKTKKWDIDKEVQGKIEDAAKMIIDGKKTNEAAQLIGMSPSNLRDTLLYRCSDHYYQPFKVDRFNIHERIKTPIPRLLPEKTIEAVQAKLKANKTIFHGNIKHKYLLSRMVLCGHCGIPLTGATQGYHQYYRHPNDRGCKRKHFSAIRADLLEKAVMVHLFQMFGDIATMEKAIKDALPDFKEREQLQRQKEQFEKELIRIKKAKDRLLDSVEKGTMDTDDIKERMNTHKEREWLIQPELAKITEKLEKIPSSEEITGHFQLLQRRIESIYSLGTRYSGMKFEEKKQLAQSAFFDKDQDGKRLGVYVTKSSDENYLWYFTMKGVLWERGDHLPMAKHEELDLLSLKDYNFHPVYGFRKQKTSGI